MTSVYQSINQRLIAELQAARKGPRGRAGATVETPGRRDADDDLADETSAGDGGPVDSADEAGQ